MCFSDFLCWWKVSRNAVINYLWILILLYDPWYEFILRMKNKCLIWLWGIQFKRPLSFHSFLISFVYNVKSFFIWYLKASRFWKLEFNWLTHPTLNLMFVKWFVSLSWFILSYWLNECSMRQRMIKLTLTLLLIYRRHIWECAREVLSVWPKNYSSFWGIICLSSNIWFSNFTQYFKKTIIGIFN